MQNYTSISKQEAIAKFGHYFILESSDNRFGYVITEKLGQYYSIFDDEESMDFDEACGSLMAKVTVNSHKKIIKNDMIMNTLSSKWDLYRYRKGWLKPEMTQNIYNFLVKNDLARSNLEMVENYVNCPIDFNLFTKHLPEQFHLPTTCFEKDKVYYQFKHSNSVNRNSEVVEVKPSSIELSFDEDNVIAMSVSFKTLDGEDVNGSVSIRDFKKYSKAATGEQYFETGYSDTFIFIDKEACKKFAIDTINKDIEHFKKSIEALS
jgi:hypothetical protein